MQRRKAAVKNNSKPPNHRLHDARAERRWSQEELAERLGTSSVNISRWENGANFPSPYFRQKLCKIFGKSLAELGLVPQSQGSQGRAAGRDAQEMPESDPLPLPHDSRIGTIPITRNVFFIGREKQLALLHERLSTARTAALTQAQALYGLGGIGKTQTAAEYAFRYSDEYANIFWIRAATRETLAADFVTLAELLELPGKEKQDQPRMIAAVKRWLAAYEGWLLILDNADDLRLAQEFLPTSHKGYILFTTRAQASGAIAASIEVEQLTPRESVLLLLRRAKLLDKDAPLDHAQATDRTTAERIVQEMDGLPLALVQAGAYIEETGCSLEDYLDLYAAHRKDLLAWRSHLALDYPETVATTWALSFQQVEQANPAAADLLRLCAFLAPDIIPEALLTRGAAALDAALAAAVADPFKLNEALEVLRRYSLVRRDASTHTLSIHRLVQSVFKDSMDQEIQRLWAERTVRVVNAAFPDAKDFGAGANNQDYLPHVQECAAHITQYHLYFPEAARLLYQAGAFLYFHGFYPQSQPLQRQALAIRRQAPVPDYPAIAESLNMLAMLFRIQGDDEQAEDCHRQALTIREKTLGPNHPATAISLNNLSVLYRNQGKYEQAEPLLQRALNIQEQALGYAHPKTLTTFINLASLYLEQRKYELAEQLLQQTLATGERVLKPDDPIIAQILNLLAKLFYEQGNYARAETLWQRSLAIIEKALGPEHPITAARLNDLAKLYVAQGRYTQAQSPSQRAFNISERILGPDHCDTIAYHELLIAILSKMEAEQDDSNPAPPDR